MSLDVDKLTDIRSHQVKAGGTHMDRKITRLSIDLAKSNFFIYGVNKSGCKIVCKPLKRKVFFDAVTKMLPEEIAMEACGSSNYWGARFEDLGIKVKIIPAQYVKPFVQSNKSDRADAIAINLAASHPHCPTIPVKRMWHMDMQSLHKERELLIKDRTALCNQMRSLLYERGIVSKQGKHNVVSSAKGNLDNNALTEITKRILHRMLRQYSDIMSYIEEIESQIKQIAQENPDCQRLQSIPGIGVITATAIVAAVPDKTHFKNGRHFAAWVGLTPRHTGTGGKTMILGISKRGNPELRRLFVQGASSVMHWSNRKDDPTSRWVNALKVRAGGNKAKIALANKTARIAFNVLCKNSSYRPAA